jgi:histone RNA hairpin-binding protein
LKQIEYGKITREYSNYVQAVPRDERSDFHPRTPNMKRKYSRRAWDGLIKQWRLNLHIWSDTPQPELDFSQNGIIRKRRIESGSDRTASPDSSDVNPEEDAESDEVVNPSNKSGLRKRPSFTDRINAEAESIFSSSWADEVDEYESELQP